MINKDEGHSHDQRSRKFLFRLLMMTGEYSIAYVRRVVATRHTFLI